MRCFWACHSEQSTNCAGSICEPLLGAIKSRLLDDEYLPVYKPFNCFAKCAPNCFVRDMIVAPEETVVFSARHFKNFRANCIDADASWHLNCCASDKPVNRSICSRCARTTLYLITVEDATRQSERAAIVHILKP